MSTDMNLTERFSTAWNQISRYAAPGDGFLFDTGDPEPSKPAAGKKSKPLPATPPPVDPAPVAEPPEESVTPATPATPLSPKSQAPAKPAEQTKPVKPPTPAEPLGADKPASPVSTVTDRTGQVVLDFAGDGIVPRAKSKNEPKEITPEQALNLVKSQNFRSVVPGGADLSSEDLNTLVDAAKFGINFLKKKAQELGYLPRSNKPATEAPAIEAPAADKEPWEKTRDQAKAEGWGDNWPGVIRRNLRSGKNVPPEVRDELDTYDKTRQKPIDPPESKVAPGATLIRYTHKDGTGLLNNNGLDRSKLTDEEEEELVDLMDLGLRQPPEGTTGKFFFTEEGEQRHARMLELLSKASKTGVVRTTTTLDSTPNWQSDDGQVAIDQGNEFLVTDESGQAPVDRDELARLENPTGATGSRFQNYEEFRQEYLSLFHQMMKYKPNEVGSGHFANKMAELADEYPEWADRAEEEKDEPQGSSGLPPTDEAPKESPPENPQSISAPSDESYASAIQAGDIKTAQRMVDEAAKAAGFNRKLYYGDAKPSESKIDASGYWQAPLFLTERDIAGKFAKYRAKKAGLDFRPELYNLYVKFENMAAEDTVKEISRRLGYDGSESAFDLFHPKDESPMGGPGPEALTDELIRLGYDSADIEYRDPENEKPTRAFAVFDLSRVKSSNPAVYDDNGDLVPLSRRFTDNPNIQGDIYSPSKPPASDPGEEFDESSDFTNLVDTITATFENPPDEFIEPSKVQRIIKMKEGGSYRVESIGVDSGEVYDSVVWLKESPEGGWVVEDITDPPSKNKGELLPWDEQEPDLMSDRWVMQGDSTRSLNNEFLATDESGQAPVDQDELARLESGNPESISAPSDESHASAVQAGDMETAQRMVDEAAKAAGYTIKAVHGTPRSGKFSVFGNKGGLTGSRSAKLAFFFSDNPDLAETYRFTGRSEPDENLINGWIDSLPLNDLRRIVPKSWKISVDDPEWYLEEVKDRALRFINEPGEDIYYAIDELIASAKTYNRIGLGVPIPSELDPDNFGQEIHVFLKIQNPYRFDNDEYEADSDSMASIVERAIAGGFDGGISTEPIADSISGVDNKKPPAGIVKFVFDPNQIKSADPAVYDDDGNLVPLSKRFTDNPDIRGDINPRSPSPNLDNEFLATDESGQAPVDQDELARLEFEGRWDSIPKAGKKGYELFVLNPLKEYLSSSGQGESQGPDRPWESGMQRWVQRAEHEGIPNAELLAQNHPEYKQLLAQLQESQKNDLTEQTESASDGDKYFHPEALADIGGYKSRDILVYLSPDQFLQLAEPVPRVDAGKAENISNVLAAGKPFTDVPMLGFVHDGKGNAKIESHEGRHRSMALKALGVEKIPVRLTSLDGGTRPENAGQAIRWENQQADSFDRLQSQWPTRLTGQDGRATIDFPVPDRREPDPSTDNEFLVTDESGQAPVDQDELARLESAPAESPAPEVTSSPGNSPQKVKVRTEIQTEDPYTYYATATFITSDGKEVTASYGGDANESRKDVREGAKIELRSKLKKLGYNL